MQTTIFLIEENYEVIANIAIKHMKKNKEQYKFLIGMPAENKLATNCLGSIGTLIEDSNNLILKSFPDEIEKDKHVIEITKDNYEVYINFHDKYALKYEMYWNADNLMKEIAKFVIYAYFAEGKIMGSIFAKKGEMDQEIFGLFVDTEDLSIYEGLLYEVVVYLKEHSKRMKTTYFIDSNELIEMANAKQMGFSIQETYKCYEL